MWTFRFIGAPDNFETRFQAIIAFAPKADLQGRVTDCSKDGFLEAVDISCHSFIRLAKRAELLMKNGGSLLTLTYIGSVEVVKHYGLMPLDEIKVGDLLRVRPGEKVPLEKVEVKLTFQKIDKVGVFEKQIIVHGDKLTDEQRQKLIDVAAKCPVQRTLEGKMEIKTV
ncbi:MAG: SDR family oxidoreductase [Rhodospirillales bacterium]|nr:SDR family oxidoreductase [Rhodospirillales bacterium]MCB9973829.1 SDR family oxidoreductase [Rhodospirillales bacterium]